MEISTQKSIFKAINLLKDLNDSKSKVEIDNKIYIEITQDLERDIYCTLDSLEEELDIRR